jgi:anaerobic selenocysteine-containing dehydrogenase
MPHSHSHSPTATTHYRICPLCEACCGLEITVDGGQVQAIRGAEADPFSQGYICPKAVALKDLHEDPDRLRTPLIRRGVNFEPASWDEAWAEIARRLQPLIAQHGRDAVALSVGNPVAHKMGLTLYFARLARALGSKNIFSASTLDQMPKQLQSGLMFGHWMSVAVPDIARCDFLLVLGANPLASNGSMWTVPDFRGKAKAMRQRGGQLVVIDPRRTETAEVADAHHFIRPGSDVYLLAAMVQTLFDQGLVRLGRLDGLVNGLDELRATLQACTPEAVAERCGIAAGTIRALARQLATTERACVYGRIGTCTQRYGTLAQWLIDVLNLLTGHLDEPGGAMFSKAPAFAANTQGAQGQPGVGKGITTGRHASRVSGAPEVFGELPITLLAEEIETPGPGQVKALITVASNPVLPAPGGPRLARALDGLDFMVSLDIYLNETSRHADVILPGLSPLEEFHYDMAFAQLSHRNQARCSEIGRAHV